LEKLQGLIKMATQVVNTAGNVLWTTDKAEFNAVTNDVTFQVYATGLGNATPVGNLYANPVRVPAGTSHQIYVGAGNYLIIVGTTFTALALGTRSSAQYSVFNAAGI
jgi:hypothetical protein